IAAVAAEELAHDVLEACDRARGGEPGARLAPLVAGELALAELEEQLLHVGVRLGDDGEPLVLDILEAGLALVLVQIAEGVGGIWVAARVAVLGDRLLELG